MIDFWKILLFCVTIIGVYDGEGPAEVSFNRSVFKKGTNATFGLANLLSDDQLMPIEEDGDGDNNENDDEGNVNGYEPNVLIKRKLTEKANADRETTPISVDLKNEQNEAIHNELKNTQEDSIEKDIKKFITDIISNVLNNLDINPTEINDKNEDIEKEIDYNFENFKKDTFSDRDDGFTPPDTFKSNQMIKDSKESKTDHSILKNSMLNNKHQFNLAYHPS